LVVEHDSPVDCARQGPQRRASGAWEFCGLLDLRPAGAPQIFSTPGHTQSATTATKVQLGDPLGQQWRSREEKKPLISQGLSLMGRE
jgi:hypothetical protein